MIAQWIGIAGVMVGAAALGRSGAAMSDAGAAIIIFSMLAVALTASLVGRYPSQ